MKVKEILMTKRSGVITIHPDNTVEEAIQLLAEKNIGAIVVADDYEKPIGILSERDIVREGAKRGVDLFSSKVGDIMTKDLIIALPEDEIDYLTATMTEKRIRHLPIMDEGQLIGIVTIGDVVKAQMVQYQGEIHHLRTYMAEYPEGS